MENEGGVLSGGVVYKCDGVGAETNEARGGETTAGTRREVERTFESTSEFSPHATSTKHSISAKLANLAGLSLPTDRVYVFLCASRSRVRRRVRSGSELAEQVAKESEVSLRNFKYGTCEDEEDETHTEVDVSDKKTEHVGVSGLLHDGIPPHQQSIGAERLKLR